MPKPLPSGADLQKLQSDTIEFTGAAASKTIEGFRRLAELNMQTARASLEQSSEQIRALLESRDTDRLTELVTSFAMLPPEKFAAYANAVYAIAHETGADIGTLVSQQIARSNEQLSETVEALARNAPGGAGGALDFITKSMDAARAAYEQMQQAAAQAAGQSGRA
ncbi:MAG: phasin family protein [Burkholderiaceae bacterium]|nr:phasin family protein [Burkholderiaceae bacterium]